MGSMQMQTMGGMVVAMAAASVTRAEVQVAASGLGAATRASPQRLAQEDEQCV